MKKLYLLLFIFVLSNSIVKSQSKINFDYNAALKFYSLCQKQNVKESDVHELLSLEGYDNLWKYLKHNWGEQYNKELYTNMFLSCFIPNKYKIKDKYQEHSWIYRYLCKMKKNKHLIKEYLNCFKQHISEETILKKAKNYLPNNVKDKIVNVYFVIGVNQGCACKHGVFIDSYYKTTDKKIKKYTEPWIAHETHHFFRSQYDTIPNNWKHKNSDLFQAFYWLETEGLAEMVGNIYPDLIFHINSEKNKNKQYKNFKNIIKSLNTKLTDYFNKKITGKEIVKILDDRKGNHNYHETGHLMAYYIEKAFGRNTLIKLIGKPINFVLKYSEAAKLLKNNLPSFNNYVMKQLTNLNQELPIKK